MEWYNRCLIFPLFCLSALLIGCGNEDEPGTDEAGSEGTEELKSYSIGDVCEIGGVKGVVFNTGKAVTKATGEVDYKVGMAISVDEVELAWSTVDEPLSGCTSTFGKDNCALIMSRPDWEENYPAVKWCNDKNKDITDKDCKWYLPSREELGEFFLIYYGIPAGKSIQSVDLETKGDFDRRFKENGGVGITDLNDRAFKAYWTSTSETKTALSGASFEKDIVYNWTTYLNWADVTFHGYGATARATNKSDVKYVRAIRKVKMK